MSQVFKIPKYVLSLYTECTMSNGAFRCADFKNKGNDNVKVRYWFYKLYKQLGVKIDPRLIFYMSIAKGLSDFTPAYCEVCGKLITNIKKAKKGNLRTCGPRCTKHLPEYVKKAKAYFSSQEFLQKRSETWLKKYGVSCAMQNKQVKNKHSSTINARYGKREFFQTKAFKDKRHATCLDKYGVEEPFSSPKIKKIALDNARKSRLYNYYPTFIRLLKKKGITANITREQYCKCPSSIEFICKKCGTSWVRHKNDELYGYTTQHIFCPNCALLYSTSHEEQRIYKYVSKLYKGTVLNNVRGVIGRKELDIYIPDKKLAIEFNGDYYHSVNKDRTNNLYYHQVKTKLCLDKGIRLIHIFEYEWKTNRKKILWLIRSALGVYDCKVYARQCRVVKLPYSKYAHFLDAYHLQGSIRSPVRLGLVFNNKLVAVAGFGKSRFSHDYELHRFCVKAKYNVIGGFSKLIKHAGINNFISYVDLSHFTGTGYEKVGFKKIGITKPSYVYVKNNHVLSRYQCQKRKLIKLLPNYDYKLSEQDNMVINGWFKIYNCGNLKMVYNKNEQNNGK